MDRQQSLGLVALALSAMLFALFAICFLAYIIVPGHYQERVIQGRPYDETSNVADWRFGYPGRADVSTRTENNVPATVHKDGLLAEDILN